MARHKQSSKNKTLRHREYAHHRSLRQEAIASSIRQKEEHINFQPCDKKMFSYGETWFNTGLSLEEAEEKFRTNINFINGFNRARRISEAESFLYDLGVSYFKNGVLVEQIPENYRKNPTVLRGYEDAMKKAKTKTL